MNWFWWDFNTLSANQFLTATGRQTIEMPAVNAFYAYSYPYSWSANSGRETANTINMFFLQDSSHSFYHFYILDKAWDGSGGNYRMSLSTMMPMTPRAMHPIGTNMGQAYNQMGSVPQPHDPIDFHDNYTGYGTNSAATATGYPGSEVYTTATTGTLPIMLRDDPWNNTYNTATGRFDFHWYWLECCTDGMVLGPMPDATVASTGFNVTYEADCANMVGLEQGTRISMWNLLGPAYSPGGCNGAPLLSSSPTYNQHGNQMMPRQANWIHYDVPMSQTCTWTSGIQLSATPCVTACARHSDCGSCSSQLECGWNQGSGECRAICDFNGPGLITYGETCPTCSAMTNPQDCMCEEGCGWAPLEGMCISGTPDYPSNQTVTVVQWETKGCPHECQPQAPSSSSRSARPSTRPAAPPAAAQPVLPRLVQREARLRPQPHGRVRRHAGDPLPGGAPGGQRPDPRLRHVVAHGPNERQRITCRSTARSPSSRTRTRTPTRRTRATRRRTRWSPSSSRATTARPTCSSSSTAPAAAAAR